METIIKPIKIKLPSDQKVVISKITSHNQKNVQTGINYINGLVTYILDMQNGKRSPMYGMTKEQQIQCWYDCIFTQVQQFSLLNALALIKN